MRGRQRESSDRRGEGTGTSGAEPGVMWTQGMLGAARSCQRQEESLPESLRRECGLSDTLIFSPVMLISDFWSPELGEKKFLLFEATREGSFMTTGAGNHERVLGRKGSFREEGWW